MPELPEVETVRRMLTSVLPGRTVATAAVSRHRLRTTSLAALPRALRARTFGMPRRVGKFLLLDLEGGHTLLSHLGMSGRWLAAPPGAALAPMPHVHLRLTFTDGSGIAYQDPRRFGMLRLVAGDRLARDPSLRLLGPDPVATPPAGEGLHVLARRARTPIKSFLLDQRRIAGLGNIYVSEILFGARVDPRRLASRLTRDEWHRIALEVPRVLGAAIDRMGTTFSTYRTVWNEPGQYGSQLAVYDRAGEPCHRCRGPIARIVQAGRSTFWCPSCQRSASHRTPNRAMARG